MVAVPEPHTSRAKEAKPGFARAFPRIQDQGRYAQDVRQDSQGQRPCGTTALFRREEIVGHRYATQEQPRAGVRPAGRHRHLQDEKKLEDHDSKTFYQTN